MHTKDFDKTIYYKKKKRFDKTTTKRPIDGGPESPCDAMWETPHFHSIKYAKLVSIGGKTIWQCESQRPNQTYRGRGGGGRPRWSF